MVTEKYAKCETFLGSGYTPTWSLSVREPSMSKGRVIIIIICPLFQWKFGLWTLYCQEKKLCSFIPLVLFCFAHVKGRGITRKTARFIYFPGSTLNTYIFP